MIKMLIRSIKLRLIKELQIVLKIHFNEVKLKFKEFKKNHSKKTSNFICEIGHVINIIGLKIYLDFLAEKNSFIFESVEKGKLKVVLLLLVKSR